MSRVVLRTVRDGQVTIYGRQFAPDGNHMAYDGRLEGLRFAFGRYHHRSDLVSLWGSEDAYMATCRTASKADQERYERGECDQPEVVDGAMPWAFWHEAASDACGHLLEPAGRCLRPGGHIGLCRPHPLAGDDDA